MRHRIDVVGVVQGVGFRPHVARLALRLGLAGWVRNTDQGVRIEVQGAERALDRFAASLVADAPRLARVDHADVALIATMPSSEFLIEASDAQLGDRQHGGSATVAADTATCRACLTEMNDPTNRRYRHAFITCTDCGPRWTIITGMPYDRPRTTMDGFDMCAACASEYHDPTSRRYHAQPIACSDCGPRLSLWPAPTHAAVRGDDKVVGATQRDLDAGRIVAVKGLGGFHLVVDATNDASVERLRARKQRPDKPFAIMVKDLCAARELAEISLAEAAALCSPARPIVLMKAHRHRPHLVSQHVAPGSPLIGIMLPYSPLHHLLFEPFGEGDTRTLRALVVTSANAAGEPIIHNDDHARRALVDLADVVCTHDRPIAVPCDDSVVRIIDGSESPVRRSRGYAPLPVALPFEVEPVLAMGGDLKNTCCVAAGRRALLSQHLGDMDSVATQTAFEVAARGLSTLHAIEPHVVVADRHPGYRSRALAERFELSGILASHHHAHLAALLAEHGVAPDVDVIGFLFDGAGWGDDDTLWGGEMLVGSYGGAARMGHLLPIRLPGGDAAVKSPWRMALAYLAAAQVDSRLLAPRLFADPVEVGVVEHQLATGFNSPRTSSMGRLIDAVASILDVRHSISHEAQAAIELESLASSADRAAAGLSFAMARDVGSATTRVDARPLIRSLVEQLRSGASTASLARGFHEAIVALIVALALRSRNDNPALTTVGLSGGVFQNELLASGAARRLRDNGFRVLTHRLVPPNDGGLSLGQAAIAGFRLAQTNSAKGSR